MGKRYVFVACVLVCVACGSLGWAAEGRSEKTATQKMKKEKRIAPQECYQCHDVIQELHGKGRHAKIGCANCHSGLAKHVDEPGPETRPGTDVSWEACGKCHKEQYASFMKEAYHRPARDEKSQLTSRAPNWTAENSDGFHNPEMARESLTKSIDESQKGIELLKKATADKVATR